MILFISLFIQPLGLSGSLFDHIELKSKTASEEKSLIAGAVVRDLPGLTANGLPWSFKIYLAGDSLPQPLRIKPNQQQATTVRENERIRSLMPSHVRF